MKVSIKRQGREAIINSAFELINQNLLFSQLTLRQVTKHAGLTPNAFYRHFATMSDLGCTLISQVSVTMSSLITVYRELETDQSSVLPVFTDIFLAEFKNKPGQLYLLQQARTGACERLRQSAERGIEKFVLAFADEIHRRSVSNNVSMVYARQSSDMITRLFIDLCVYALNKDGQKEYRIKQQIVQYAQIILVGAHVLSDNE